MSSRPVRSVMTSPTRSTLVVLCLLAALGSLTVDLYLPALPRIQTELGATTAATQLSLTATTLGFALGQLLVGNWADAAGRRTPLIASTALHVVASIGVASAGSIGTLLAFRLVQGFGAAGSAVASMAIVRDLYSGSRFVEVLARIAVVTGLAPVLAPFLGVQLLSLMDWRGIFVVIAGYGALMLLIALVGLRETLPPQRRLPMHPRAIATRYAGLARTPDFLGSALVGGLIVSGVFTMMTASSFLLQETYALDSTSYSIVFACNAVAFVVGTQASARLVRRAGPYRVLRVSLPLVALAGFAIIPAAASGVPGITAATVVFMAGAGTVGPCTSVIAMGRQAHQAGTASAFLGAANFGMAGLTAPLVGVLGVESVAPMALLMGGCVAIAVAVYWLMIERVRPASHDLASLVADSPPAPAPTPATESR
ncbi:multidrug effflux MFS transporter [Demequina sp.]|uniref:multidrug effflux MFS transporter n=1 Tax=Demequina sp. TaxID=2050685 RepID=UPI003A84C2F3